ncbi:hypothetical protein [Tropicibacter oceani]|uniref:DUF1036 domain-containing protein n=1 Tax=Tropicibacter oceani TaxID=3058420 RepID=A0ABY8QN98_9RHOB|nr:hypothetical protein [Tropicibacter oceani]WGW05292.1 hypothetical protein QF118_07030 [Tropicibacter oceani]
MIRSFALVSTLLAAAPTWAEPVTYRFVWTGAQGYSMTGAMSFDSAFLTRDMVREGDLSCFHITGFFEGQQIGRWALTMLNEDTSWRLHFVPRESAFVVEGRGIPMAQAWNMNGAGDDCGEGGFGFNLGNLGQDFCRNDEPLFASRIDPFTPFPAVRDDDYVFPAGACNGPAMLSLAPSPSVPPT